MRSNLILGAVLVAASLVSGHASADPPSRKERVADTLFESAKAAMERGDLSTACAQLAESQRLDPAAGTLLNLGECEERWGKLAAALGHFKAARADLPPGDFRIPFTDSRIAGVAGRVPHIVVRLTDPALPAQSITCDDHEVNPTSLGQPLAVDPGTHSCRLRAPGHLDAIAQVSLKEGESQTLELRVGAVTLAHELSPPSSVAATAPGVRDETGSWSGRRTLGLVVGGAGVVAIGAGAILGLVAKGTYDSALSSDCKGAPSGCNPAGASSGRTAHTEAGASTAAFIAGGALVAGGAVLYLTAPSAGGLNVSPSVGPTGAGLSLRGAW